MRRILVGVGVVVIVTTAIWGGVWIWNQTIPGPQLPLVQNIVRIHANSHDKKIEFDIPETYWQPILDAVAATKKDSHPAKWVLLRHLTISLDDGSTFLITVYETGKQYAAISAGKNHVSRIYYRGGSEPKLHGLLTEAQATATWNPNAE